MAGKANGSHNMETEWARAPPPPGSAWQRFCKALYDPEEKSFLGRTPKRWAILLAFYAVFYAVLAAMFAACMAGLFYNLDADRPHYTLKSSLIGENPGISYRPLPEDANVFVLKYSASNLTQPHPILTQLDDFFKAFKSPSLAAKTECTGADNYGFPLTPCFFIKVNRIWDWVPEVYEASALPEEMPDKLKTYIGNLPAADQKQVWIHCWDEVINSTTTFEYPWGQGIPEAAFPYNNAKRGTPVVAVRITPEARKPVTVRCRGWAKNIGYNKSIKEPRGYARIQFEDQDAEVTSATITER